MTGYLQEPRKKPVTVPTLMAMCAAGEKITMLTCYDASFAALLDACGVDMLLVGDSVSMVCQGHSSTLPVTVDEMVYHTACVARGNKTALLVADLPFGTYATPEQAHDNAARLIKAGAHMVKMEGGAWLAETIAFLTQRGIPVCAHLGLTPQSVHALGGYRVQGKTSEAAEQLRADALAVQEAGASTVVLEAIPAPLGQLLTQLLAIPTIGIGAGPGTSGQVLVLHDMLGVYPGHKAKFVRNFMNGQTSMRDAILSYVGAVRSGAFPAAEHCF